MRNFLAVLLVSAILFVLVVVPVSSQGMYCGTKNSDVYHYSSCSYVKQITPSNLIWFADAQDAVNKGYRPCLVCKPPLPGTSTPTPKPTPTATLPPTPTPIGTPTPTPPLSTPTPSPTIASTHTPAPTPIPTQTLTPTPTTTPTSSPTETPLTTPTPTQAPTTNPTASSTPTPTQNRGKFQVEPTPTIPEFSTFVTCFLLIAISALAISRRKK